MAISFKHTHPQFAKRREDWTLLDDAYQGQSCVKGKTTIYLPATSGQLALGMGTSAWNSGGNSYTTKKSGQILYDAYLARALFPDVLRATVQSLVGLMVREPWNIKLPQVMEPMMEEATDAGESMTALVDRILENVLLSGRNGLLLDVDEKQDLPYLVPYQALQMINWDDTPDGPSTRRRLKMAVLDETSFERGEASLQWSETEKFRLLSLGDIEGGDDAGGVYTVRTETERGIGDPIQPSVRGKTLDAIPFEFINATDLLPSPGEVPLIGLARLAMAIYRGEADYRQALFMQGQDTLVLRGVANPNEDDVPNPEGHVTAEQQMQASGSKVVVGAGAIIYLPDTEMDAKYIGVESKGLEEMRTGLENDYDRAAQFGMTLLTSGSSAEAEGTLRTRVAARTASLASIAKTSAAGLESILKIGAEWMGGNPDQAVVEPNLDFVEDPMLPEELVKLIEAKLRGMPLSWRTLHNQARRRGLTDMSLEDERDEISGEPAPDLGIGEEDPEPGQGDGGKA